MKTLKFNQNANSLLEVTITLCFITLIITYLLNHVNNNAVQAKNNYLQWREEKSLQIKNAGL